MPRVPTFAVHQLTLAQTLDTQSRLIESQIQVSSGKVARSYTGVALESRRLVNLENAISETNGFVDIIDRTSNRLQIMETNVASAFDVAADFRTLLVDATNADNASLVALNQRAKDFMVQLGGLLNVKDDNRHVFAGSRIDTPPVDLSILFNTNVPLVKTAEFTGTATNSLTGITSLTGIVSVEADSGNTDDAFQLTYNATNKTFQMTNLNGGANTTVSLGNPLLPGELRKLDFNVGGERVVVTIDESFDPLTDITTDTLSGIVDTAGFGVGAFGTITVKSTSGNVSTIDRNIVETSGTAASATLTLNSTDGDFVATGVDLSVSASLVPVTLTNATTGATVVLDVNVTTGLNDAAVASNLTEIRLNNFLENVAATNGTINTTEARPGDPGYDSTKPSYYKGDYVSPTVRVDPSTTVDYGVNAAESGFEKLFRALFMAKNADTTSGSVDTATLESALGLVTQAIDEIPNIRTRIGSDRVVLDTMKSRHDEFILFANQSVGQIEDVDVASAITKISFEQTQLEASYLLSSRLAGLSIAQFLR